jgi:LysM repeat protein
LISLAESPLPQSTLILLTPTSPTATQTAPTLPRIITLTAQPSPSPVGSQTPLRSPTSIPTQTAILVPQSINCPVPSGWLPYMVQPEDTLDRLALRYRKTSTEISQVNCLVTTILLAGQMIYLPPPPSPTAVVCSPPPTWVIYIVQKGDTLYHLGQVYGIPYTEIKHANCLVSSDILIGQSLRLPPWATHTPSPTPILFYETPTETVTADTSTPTEVTTPEPTGTIIP